MWLIGSIVVTKKRFACNRGGILQPVFKVPVDHYSFKACSFEVDEKSRPKRKSLRPSIQFSDGDDS